MSKKVSNSFFVGFLALSLGCVTLGKRTVSDQSDHQATANQVVAQPGQSEAVFSNKPREYWLSLRQSKQLLTRFSGALATGEAEEAVTLARSHLAKNPGDIQGLRFLAAALALNQKYELAEFYAGLVESQQPGDAFALNIRGIATMVRPKNRFLDYKRAEDYFARAFAADSRLIAAGLNLGSLRLELGDAKAALATFETVTQQCGGCSAGFMGQGIAASRTREFAKAKSAFEAVLAKNPRHAGALYHLALVYKNGYNDKKQAERHFLALLNDKGRKVDAYMKERANSALRAMKGEKNIEDRVMVAEGATPDSSDEASDADLLMSSAEMESQ